MERIKFTCPIMMTFSIEAEFGVSILGFRISVEKKSLDWLDHSTQASKLGAFSSFPSRFHALQKKNHVINRRSKTFFYLTKEF